MLIIKKISIVALLIIPICLIECTESKILEKINNTSYHNNSLYKEDVKSREPLHSLKFKNKESGDWIEFNTHEFKLCKVSGTGIFKLVFIEQDWQYPYLGLAQFYKDVDDRWFKKNHIFIIHSNALRSPRQCVLSVVIPLCFVDWEGADIHRIGLGKCNTYR